MNESDLAVFRGLIRSRLSELAVEDALGHAGQAVVELDQQAVGRLSRMDALQNQAMAKAQQSRRAAETTRLQAALTRLQDGDYGFCEDCGEEIAQGRLRINLTALHCVSCATG